MGRGRGRKGRVATIGCALTVLLGCDAEADDMLVVDPPSHVPPAAADMVDPLCGNGVIDAQVGETCDGEQLGGATCSAAGFEGGEMFCLPGCTLSQAACFRCGDGVRNGDEACDGSDLGAFRCVDAGYTEGGLAACTAQCTIDDTTCRFVCGDGRIDGAEQCDHEALDGLGCADLGYDDGALSCNASCVYDVGACVNAPCKALGDDCETDGECCGPPHGSGTCDSVCR